MSDQGMVERETRPGPSMRPRITRLVEMLATRIGSPTAPPVSALPRSDSDRPGAASDRVTNSPFSITVGFSKSTGRNGVPAYVLYRPGKAPLLLPEILTQQAVIDALATLPAQPLARQDATVAATYGATSQ